jgi:serine phosphatase RsbU (regulator of sigma subunit)
MIKEENANKPMRHKRQRKTLKWWPRLQVRMTISYVGVSVVTALLIELLLFVIFLVVLSPLIDQNVQDTARRTAQSYALEAADQGGGVALNPQSTFQPSQPFSLVLPGGDVSQQTPYIEARSHAPQMGEFALLLTPNGQILASSYPARYPLSASVAHLLPEQKQLILNALAGRGGSKVELTAQGHVVSATEPIWSKNRKPIGAMYVQMTSITFGGNILSFIGFWLVTGLFWLILTAPVGAIFGVLTTRGLVRRLHRLVGATAQFANGDYTQRVQVKKQDEIGQLEQQFNNMAQQLVESMEQRQILIEQNARLEERTRIEQELHTARLIQHSLLPKEVPTLAGWQIATYYQSAREVGGDLYDFLTFEDGRLGLVIGDVADKGVPAAMVMASTRSMLRAAAQVTDSPGEVLARVNDLLYPDMPPNMFVTCFYAVLDPDSGRLRYANAGHDLPYQRDTDKVCELHATGMPLGLMPGMRYEEQEVIVASDESILFYSDGLVEAHNSRGEMFGFPRLQALLQEHADGATLIDFLLSELKSFTGQGWEQEDDMTLLALQRMPEVLSTNEQQREQAGRNSWMHTSSSLAGSALR